jgi:hypothetical protein
MRAQPGVRAAIPSPLSSVLWALFEVRFAVSAPSGHPAHEGLALRLDFGRRDGAADYVGRALLAFRATWHWRPSLFPEPPSNPLLAVIGRSRACSRCFRNETGEREYSCHRSQPVPIHPWFKIFRSPYHHLLYVHDLARLMLIGKPSNQLAKFKGQFLKPASSIFLPAEWFDYVRADHINEAKPGIYEWRIEGTGVYIGKYTWISRPTKEYAKNVLRILNGLPYRPKNPNGFRRIHRALVQAHREGRKITLTILENVEPSNLNQREHELIAERGTLNGQISN